jgi:hypothetical protein
VLEEAHDDLDPGGLLEVDADRALVAVEVEGDAAELGVWAAAHHPAAVSSVGFDLDDFGAEIAKQL